MARNLVPLKVRIGLHGNGHAKYPDFNSLKTIQDIGVDWSVYVDMYGDGWLYDKKSGHRDDTPDSPFGQQWGVLLVPEEFASEAAKAFPDG